MKRIASVFVLIIGINIVARGVEPIDTASYVEGFMSAITMIEEFGMEESEVESFVKGIDDNRIDNRLLADSSLFMSYSLGAMQGIYITDGVSGEESEKSDRLHCMIRGMRRVASGNVVLPADTVEAKKVLEENTQEHDSADICRRYECLGLMKAFSGDIQSLMDEMTPGRNIVADRLAFSSGLADMIELSILKPESGYDLGRYIASPIIFIRLRKNFNVDDYYAGAKMAVGIGEPRLNKDDIAAFIEQKYRNRDDEIEYRNSRENRDVSGTYNVDWSVVMYPVAKVKVESDSVTSIFMSVLELIDAELMYDACIIEIESEQVSSVDKAHKVLKTINTPLPEGFEWFGKKGKDGKFVLAVVESNNCFLGHASVASIKYNIDTPETAVAFDFDGNGKQDFAQFTSDNINRYVTMVINDVYTGTPRINSEIEAGHCFTWMSGDEIDKLFDDAQIVSK